MSIENSAKTALSGLLVLLLATFATDSVDANNAAQANKPKPEPRQAKPPYVGESAIMAEPMNGADVAEFEAAIKKVEEQATAAEYRKLKNAIGYHLTYDLEVGRNKAKLYKKLNGQTPNQIVTGMQSR